MDYLIEMVVSACELLLILVIVCAGLGLAIGAFVGTLVWMAERLGGL